MRGRRGGLNLTKSAEKSQEKTGRIKQLDNLDLILNVFLQLDTPIWYLSLSELEALTNVNLLETVGRSAKLRLLVGLLANLSSELEGTVIGGGRGRRGRLGGPACL